MELLLPALAKSFSTVDGRRARPAELSSTVERVLAALAKTEEGSVLTIDTNSKEFRREERDARYGSKCKTVSSCVKKELTLFDLNVWVGAAFGLEELLTLEEKQNLFVPALKASKNNPDATIRSNAELFLARNATNPSTNAQARSGGR